MTSFVLEVLDWAAFICFRLHYPFLNRIFFFESRHHFNQGLEITEADHSALNAEMLFILLTTMSPLSEVSIGSL